MLLVRHGHGDLHLGNIALIEGKPVLFDAIEFDPLVASGDVLYDLSFLVMDLVERGLSRAANIVLNRYLAETKRDDDLDALAALPFFMSMRAAIRAKVIAAKREHATNDEARSEIAARAIGYFTLARQLIAPPPPMLIAIGGLSGTGKSVLARMLASAIPPVPGAVILRSDTMRKALFDYGETEKLPERAYSAAMTAKVYGALADRARRVLSAGHSAVIDAVFTAQAEREDATKLAEKMGVPFHGLFLTADLETRIARVDARVGDASDADAAVVRLQAGYDLGAIEWTSVDASGTPEMTLERAKAVLSGIR